MSAHRPQLKYNNKHTICNKYTAYINIKASCKFTTSTSIKLQLNIHHLSADSINQHLIYRNSSQLTSTQFEYQLWQEHENHISHIFVHYGIICWCRCCLLDVLIIPTRQAMKTNRLQLTTAATKSEVSYP
jgi:hypothetical protein